MVNSPRAGSLGEAASTEALVFHVAAVCLRIELTVRLERPGDQQLPVVAVGQQSKIRLRNLLDDRLRRTCRREHADEVRRDEIGQALLDGGRKLGRGR